MGTSIKLTSSFGSKSNVSIAVWFMVLWLIAQWIHGGNCFERMIERVACEYVRMTCVHGQMETSVHVMRLNDPVCPCVTPCGMLIEMTQKLPETAASKHQNNWSLGLRRAELCTRAMQDLRKPASKLHVGFAQQPWERLMAFRCSKSFAWRVTRDTPGV